MYGKYLFFFTKVYVLERKMIDEEKYKKFANEENNVIFKLFKLKGTVQIKGDRLL